jgi:hypothetical protein
MVGVTDFLYSAFNGEFIVAGKTIIDDHQIPKLTTQVLLAWDAGHLVEHQTDDQLCCIPRLCMTELLPHGQYEPIIQQSGWLIIRDKITFHTASQVYQQYMLYDLRCSRLVASFVVRKEAVLTIGKATVDKVQVYCGYSMRIPFPEFITDDSSTHQYQWYMMQVNIRPSIQAPTVDLTWYDQVPTPDIMKTVRERHRVIRKYAIEHGHWCDKAYKLTSIQAMYAMPLPERLCHGIRVRHLIDDLFLISSKERHKRFYDVFLVHSVYQDRIIWKETALDFDILIPEEKAILTYDTQGLVELLDMRTGDTLNLFELGSIKYIKHVIGPICYVAYAAQAALIDVRTGKKIRYISPRHRLKSSVNPTVRTDMGNSRILHFLGPTRIEYINLNADAIWIDEYAQV